MPVTPADLLARAVRRDPAGPLITYYDDVTGERTELSATTLANWVAKAANLLQDEFDVARGSRVAVALPVHWQTAAALLAVWSCGAVVVDTAAEDDGGLADVDVVLAAQDRLEAIGEAGGAVETIELLGFSLDPLGRGMTGYGGPARDFALEVRVQADSFQPYEPPDPDSPGLVVSGLELSLGGLGATAGELTDRLHLREGDRVLIDDATAGEAGPVAWLLAPLAAGASVVLCRRPDPGLLPRRAVEERVTASLGTHLDGVRTLGRPPGSAAE